MMLYAWSIGVGSAMATIHDEACASDLFHLPETYGAQWGIAFGYPTENPNYRKGGRKALDEIVYWEAWESLVRK